MSTTWYKKHGFYHNPLSIKPAAFTDDILGFPTNEVFLLIDRKGVGFIEGNLGFGKTAVLKRIIHRYEGNKRVLYYSCNRNKSLDVDALLIGAGSFLSRLFKKKTKDMIFLLDEASSLKEADTKRLESAYKKGYIRSIIMVGQKRPKLPPYLQKKTIFFKMPKLTAKDAVELVRKRVGEFSMLPDAIIKKVFAKVKSNPRLLFQRLEDLCYLADNLGDTVVRDEHIKKIFS